MRLFVLLFAGLASGCATMAPEASGPAWPAAPREFATPADAIAAAEQFPNSAGMARRRLALALQAGDREAALASAQRLAAMGAVLSAQSAGQVRALIGEAAMAPIAARFAANAAPMEASTLRAVIPAERRLVEGLVWDSARRRLLATTVVDGELGGGRKCGGDHWAARGQPARRGL